MASAQDQSGQAAKFWDKMAEGYFKKPISDLESYQKKIEITQSYLLPHMKLLEFGCGTGSTSLLHAPLVKHILATDVSSNMIEIAKKQAKQKQIKNIDFMCASVNSLIGTIPKSSMDAVLGLNILHLVEDRRNIIQETYNWLKPGGIFVTNTACINDMSIAPLFKLIAPVGIFFGLIPPVVALSKDELMQEFKDAGFTIEQEWRPRNSRSGKSDTVFIIGKKPE